MSRLRKCFIIVVVPLSRPGVCGGLGRRWLFAPRKPQKWQGGWLQSHQYPSQALGLAVSTFLSLSAFWHLVPVSLLPGFLSLAAFIPLADQTQPSPSPTLPMPSPPFSLNTPSGEARLGPDSFRPRQGSRWCWGLEVAQQRHLRPSSGVGVPPIGTRASGVWWAAAARRPQVLPQLSLMVELHPLLRSP